jgi:putative transposase
LRRLKRLYPWLKVVFADSAYDRLAALLACFLLGLTLVVIRRLAGTKGFVLLPRRWVAERTLGWLGRWRRLAKEYEELPEVSKTMVKLAMIRLMLHRLPTRTASDYPHPDLSNGLLARLWPFSARCSVGLAGHLSARSFRTPWSIAAR